MTTIQIPGDLAVDIDRLAGPARRSDYASDVLWRDVPACDSAKRFGIRPARGGQRTILNLRKAARLLSNG